jgi:hypothetical protein
MAYYELSVSGGIGGVPAGVSFAGASDSGFLVNIHGRCRDMSRRDWGW